MDAFQYILTLSESSLNKLYEDPWAVQAVFQSLKPLSKQLVMRLLCIEDYISIDSIKGWLRSDVADTSILPNSLKHLKSLKIFQEKTGQIRMNDVFKKKLMHAVSNLDRTPWGIETKEQTDKLKPIDPVRVEMIARSKWDSVLHFMVGSKDVKDPPQAVVDILLQTRLMESKDKRTFHITSSGYEFMLTDVHVQMWSFMLAYIKTLSKSGRINAEDILGFLFQLSYCQTGVPYAVKDLNDIQSLLFHDFTNFGLIFCRTKEAFYITSLAVNLVFGGSKGQIKNSVQVSNSFSQVRSGMKSQLPKGVSITTDSSCEMSLIVETNFKVYAYTSSALHVAMLSVFVDIVTRLPNLAVGFITRESLRSALMHGISAQQIYDFIMKHAHPRMKDRVPVIPENIADQLYLWEKERNRISFVDSTLYDGFQTKHEFEKVLQYCKDQNVLTWNDPINFKLTVSSKGEQTVSQYIRNTLNHS